MNSKLILAAIVAAAAAASPAMAERGQNGLTVGDCISDGFYGNEPNMADGSLGGPSEQQPGTKGGNVVPSQSPGPFVTNPNTGEVTRGHSVGYYNSQGINIPEICRALTEGG
jgi:hypothetical protein